MVWLTGVGKTTLVQKACEALVSSGTAVGGFYTEEVREGGRRVGFDVVTVTGERAQLSRVRYQGSPALSEVPVLAVQSFPSRVPLFCFLTPQRPGRFASWRAGTHRGAVRGRLAVV